MSRSSVHTTSLPSPSAGSYSLYMRCDLLLSRVWLVPSIQAIDRDGRGWWWELVGLSCGCGRRWTLREIRVLPFPVNCLAALFDGLEAFAGGTVYVVSAGEGACVYCLARLL